MSNRIKLLLIALLILLLAPYIYAGEILFPEVFSTIKVFEGEKEIKVSMPNYCLKKMREKSLYQMSLSSKTDCNQIRLIWERTFHNPILFKVERNKSNYTVYMKMLSRHKSRYGLRKINRKMKVDETIFTKILELLNEMGFWTLQTAPTHRTIDGSQWYLEVLIDNKYHIIKRFTPIHYQDDIENKVLIQLAQYLLDLIEVDIQERDFY